jgi:hypothetical protein
MFTLFPYQKDAVERHLKILDSIGASLDGTGCGGGKTVIASAVASRYSLRVGVVCPKSVIAKWTKTLASFGVSPLFVLNPEKLRNGNSQWVDKIPTKGKPKFEWKVPQGTLLIFDEAHCFGAYDSQNGRLLEAAIGIPTLMLSATAAESPLKMKGIGAQLRLFHPRGFWSWVRKMGATDGNWGGLAWEPSDLDNKERMKAIHDSIFTSRGHRVPENVLKEQLPELLTSDEPLCLTRDDFSKIKELYKNMTEPDDPGGVKNLRQRQAIELVKIPALSDRAREVVESGGSVVVFLNFHASIDELLRLNPEAGVLDGRVANEIRLKTQDRFQSGELKIIIVQIAAGGQSIDLHDTSGENPRVALICPQFSGLVEEQALGRIARVGAKGRAVAIRLFAPGGVEERALEITSQKRENVKFLNEGGGEVVSKAMEIIITSSPEREHSKHSPSSLKEKAKCPGFRNDNTRDTSAADRGVLGHAAVEKENLDIIPNDDPKLREAAEMCLKYLSYLRGKLVDIEEIRERKYWVLDQFGHVDHIILHGICAELIDYKFAWGKYEADSPQFWAYAIGIFDAHPEVQKINIHVLLPFQDVIDVESFSRETDYDRLCSQVSAIVAAAESDRVEDYATGGHCTWCMRRAECPKLREIALTIAKEYKPEELLIPEQYDPALITDPEKMALAKKLSPIMKSWAEKVERRALEMRRDEGIEIPGFELAEKNSPFKVTDPQAAWEVVKDKITPEAFAACADISIGELEKAVARTAERGQMAKAKAALRDSLIDANAAKVDGKIQYLKKIS